MTTIRRSRRLAQMMVTTVFFLSGYVPRRLQEDAEGSRLSDEPDDDGTPYGSAGWRSGTEDWRPALHVP